MVHMQHILIMEMPMPQQFSSAGLVLDNCTKNTILSTVHKNHAAKMCKVYIRYDNFCQAQVVLPMDMPKLVSSH